MHFPDAADAISSTPIQACLNTADRRCMISRSLLSQSPSHPVHVGLFNERYKARISGRSELEADRMCQECLVVQSSLVIIHFTAQAMRAIGVCRVSCGIPNVVIGSAMNAARLMCWGWVMLYSRLSRDSLHKIFNFRCIWPKRE